MMRFKKRAAAFTLVELLIVITVVIILSTAAIPGSRQLIDSLRFQNAWNAMNLMVQRARSMAVAGREGAAAFGVEFEFGEGGKITLSEISGDGATSQIEDTYNIDPAWGLAIFAKGNGAECSGKASIIFPVMGESGGISGASFSCGTDGSSNITSLLAGIKETAGTREKTFTVNQITAILQIAQ